MNAIILNGVIPVLALMFGGIAVWAGVYIAKGSNKPAFRVRDGRTGKWRTTHHKMTLVEAAKRHGEGNYEVLEWSKEVRRPS